MHKLVTKIIAFVFMLAFVLPASAADTEEEALKAAQKRIEINKQLEETAKEMAKLLAHPGFRGILQSEIAKSKNREKILMANAFLERTAGKKDSPPGLQKLRDKANKARGLIKTSGVWDMEGLDIYFPVEEHRKKWKGKTELLVAYSPVDAEEEVMEIIAYSVMSGDRIPLNAENLPEVPVLMIAPEEHDSHAVEPPPPPTDEGAVKGPEPKNQDEPKGDNNSYFGVKYLRIDDDQEPWWKGNPEIYSYYIQRYGTYCQEKYTNLFWVNTTASWYDVWLYIARYFNTNSYSNWSYIRIYERDGGTYRIKAFTKDGVTCRYGMYDDDDYIATRWRYKSSYGFDYDYTEDWGRAAVKLRKVH